MKLKGLKNRAYNIFFHTHTVAGITISFALFVIFYAGAFAIFRHDIYQWENPQARIEASQEVDFEKTMAAVEAYYPNFSETDLFTLRLPNEQMPFIQFFGAEYMDEKQEETERFKTLINAENNYELFDLKEPKTTVGDTLYHLHYFDQIPLGLYISGFVSLFFLFASVTGIMIHWRNLVTKFYAFTVKGKWKQIWTNAHTVLGVIGLPFQIVYAVTGALFGLLTLLLIPSAFVLFGGDTDKVLATVRPESAIKVSKDAPLAEHASIASFYERTQTLFPEIAVSNIRIQNYHRTDGFITFYLDDERTINGTGQVTYALNSGKILSQTDPKNKTYTESVLNAVTKLHFATFGGWTIKIIYFILAMITCFMILSGVLLWQEARNNKRYTDKQKRFHHRVTKTYLAICLGLFPATAIIFIANKAVPMDLIGRTTYVNTAFFLSWLLLIIAGLFWNNFRKLNRNYLQIGGILSLLVPVANGIVTGDWFWKTIASAQWYVASVDIFWMLTGLSALVVTRWIQTSQKEEKVKHSKRVKNPTVSVESLVMNYDKRE